MRSSGLQSFLSSAGLRMRCLSAFEATGDAIVKETVDRDAEWKCRVGSWRSEDAGNG